MKTIDNFRMSAGSCKNINISINNMVHHIYYTSWLAEMCTYNKLITIKNV